MTALKNIPALIGGAAVLAAATIGLTAGLAPASAAPPEPKARLAIIPDPANGNNYRLTVTGKFPMTEYDATGYINNLETGTRPGGGGTNYTIFGRDGEFESERIVDLYYQGSGERRVPGQVGYLIAQPDGIHYMQEISIMKHTLNEDFDFNGPTEADEIYVAVDFIDGDNGKRTAYSNVISGIFQN